MLQENHIKIIITHHRNMRHPNFEETIEVYLGSVLPIGIGEYVVIQKFEMAYVSSPQSFPFT